MGAHNASGHGIDDCLSYLNLIGQLEGNISPYCPPVIARAYSDARYCLSL